MTPEAHPEPTWPAQPDPRYPIGRFTLPPPDQPLSEGLLEGAIWTLSELPEGLRNACTELNQSQLDSPYRDGGWTVRQLVHHIADSHMNAFLRVRLALTEDQPNITAYDEAAWAKLHDSVAPIEWSLELLEALHARWVMLLQSLRPEQWRRTFVHPERGPQSVEFATLLYAWHSRHHVAHITHLRMARNW